jgi:hypothetical protein
MMTEERPDLREMFSLTTDKRPVVRMMFDPEIRSWTEDAKTAGGCQACHARDRVVVIQVNNTLLRFCYSCLKRIKDTTNF